MATTRFAGFELDDERAELRGPDGTPIRLRRKTFEMLRLFAANPGRVLSKPELMEAVWVAAEMRAGGAYAHSTLMLATAAEEEEKRRSRPAR